MSTNNAAGARLRTISETTVPLPKYYQLEGVLREQAATWEPGQSVPSEAELCQTYGVSRTTARKALDDLTREGLFYRVQGKGTFVAQSKVSERFAQHTVGFYEDMVSRGYNVRTDVREQVVIDAPGHIAGKLNLMTGESVVKLVRVRYIASEPILISTTYLPHRMCPGLEREDLSDTSLYAVLRERYGIIPARGTRTIGAASSTEEEAALLGIAATVPLLVLTTTMYDMREQPIEYGFARHRADRSEIEIEVVLR